jgi:hypothetical protein
MWSYTLHILQQLNVSTVCWLCWLLLGASLGTNYQHPRQQQRKKKGRFTPCYDMLWPAWRLRGCSVHYVSSQELECLQPTSMSRSMYVGESCSQVTLHTISVLLLVARVMRLTIATGKGETTVHVAFGSVSCQSQQRNTTKLGHP